MLLYCFILTYFPVLFLVVLLYSFIPAISSFIPSRVTVQIYSQQCYWSALFPTISSLIPGHVIVQLYSRPFPALLPAVLLYSFIPNPCYCSALFPAISQLYSLPCYSSALFPPISSFIPGRVTVQIYSRPYSALFPLCRNASFFAVQQRLTIPGLLHNVRMQHRPEEQFSSRKTPRRHIINENKAK
jgi:hypothetical protein